MLIARGLSGWGNLGAPIHTGTHQLPGQTGTTPTAGTFTPPPNGYVRGDIYYQERQYLKTMVILRDALRANLLAMYQGGQILDCSNPALGLKNFNAAQSAIFGGIYPVTTLDKVCSYWDEDSPISGRYLRVRGMGIMDPVGVISDYVTLGVPFEPSQLKLGNPTHPDERTLEATYSPTPDQRWLAERAIYTKSQLQLALMYYGVDLSGRSNVNYVLADNTDATGLVGLMTRTATIKARYVVSKASSIRQFINAFKLDNGEPRFTTHLANFTMNPILPMPEELDEPQGLYNYYKRGGFLLDKEAARGVEPVARGPLRFTQSFCVATGCSTVPVPVPIQTKFPGETEGWLSYVTIKPNGQLTIRVQAKERSTVEKISLTIANFMEKFVKWACVAAPAIAQYNAALPTAETCRFPDGSPCVKGQTKMIASAGSPQGTVVACDCVKPADSQIFARGVASGMMTKVCGVIPSPIMTTPPPVFEPPTSTNYMPWIVMGGAILGAIWLAKRQ